MVDQLGGKVQIVITTNVTGEAERSLRAARARLSRHIASHIRDLIVSGQLKPGSRLRLEPLAQLLEASTTPVREALLLLESEGLVRSEPHRGFFVQRLSPRDIGDVFDVHAVIAGKLAARASAVITPDQLAELVAIDESIRRAAREEAADTVEHLNYEFHRKINLAADSPLLAQLLGRTTRYVPRRFYAQIPGWLTASAEEHGPIIQALKDGDGERARVVTEQHIRESGSLLVNHLAEIGLWATPNDGAARPWPVSDLEQ